MNGINTKHFASGSECPNALLEKKMMAFVNMRFCPYAQRAALVLIAKGVP